MGGCAHAGAMNGSVPDNLPDIIPVALPLRGFRRVSGFSAHENQIVEMQRSLFPDLIRPDAGPVTTTINHEHVWRSRFVWAACWPVLRPVEALERKRDLLKRRSVRPMDAAESSDRDQR